jgi:hypothetical protein
MSSALCASAPSHPLHAMPPRFTRNSDRPRASDRTMVDTKNTRHSLANFSRHHWRRHHRQMNPTGMANKPEPKPLAQTERHSYRQWAGSRETNPLASGRGEVFFLTSLLIELIDASMRMGHRPSRVALLRAEGRHGPVRPSDRTVRNSARGFLLSADNRPAPVGLQQMHPFGLADH